MIFIKFLLMSLGANAYLGLLTDGDVVGVGEHQIGAESQFVFNKNDGLNIAGHYATGISDDIEFMADLGFGATDFYLGSYAKYVPYPDYQGQPAIGFIAGLVYTNVNSESYMSANGKAFASKRYDFDYGEISPYGGLSYTLNFTNTKGIDDPLHLILGAKYKHFDWEALYIYSELGTSLVDAFNYLSIKVVFPFPGSDSGYSETYLNDI